MALPPASTGNTGEFVQMLHHQTMPERYSRRSVRSMAFQVRLSVAVGIERCRIHDHEERAKREDGEFDEAHAAQGASTASVMPWMIFLSAGQIVASTPPRVARAESFSPVTK